MTQTAQLNAVAIALSFTVGRTSVPGIFELVLMHGYTRPALSLSTRSSQTLTCCDDWSSVLACNTYNIYECRPPKFCTDTSRSVCHNCKCVMRAVKTLTRYKQRVRTTVSLTRRSSFASVLCVSTSLPCLHHLMILVAIGRLRVFQKNIHLRKNVTYYFHLFILARNRRMQS